MYQASYSRFIATLFSAVQIRASLASSDSGKAIGFRILFSRNVGNGKDEQSSKLSADPIQRMQPRAPAGVRTVHLLNHYFGI